MKRSLDTSGMAEMNKRIRYTQHSYPYPYVHGALGMSFPQPSTDMYGQFPGFMANGMPQYQSQTGTQMQQYQQHQQQHQQQTQFPAPQFQGQANFGSYGQAAYGQAAGQYAQGAGFASNLTVMRTVYLGNLPMPITYEEILNHVKTGAVEHVRILEDKQCVFVTFVEPMSAMQFHNDAIQKRLCLLGQEVKVGWGKPSPIPTNILTATQNGASRNVYIGNIDESVTDQYLQSEFSKFGPVDQIRVLLEKRIAFVHMTSIAAAIKVVTSLSQDPSWSGRRVNYGKDRCIPNKQMNPAAVSSALGGASGMMFQSGFPSQFGGMLSSGYPYDPHYVGGGNRTVYLGGIHQDATTKDLCDVIRGGILQNIKYLPDKNIAFVTFISPTAAYNFHNRGTYEGIVIKGKRVKIGWGKAVPIPANVAAAAQSGASRNVYIGAIDETITEEKLRKDFAEFGDIELVNIIQDKNIGFVNFTDILAAVKAVESLKISPEYSRFKINYGKDRCGNEPRPPRVNPSAAHGSHSHGGPAGPSNVISPATEFRANGGANAGASGALSPYATDNGIGGVEGYQISDHGSPTQFI